MAETNQLLRFGHGHGTGSVLGAGEAQVTDTASLTRPTHSLGAGQHAANVQGQPRRGTWSSLWEGHPEPGHGCVTKRVAQRSCTLKPYWAETQGRIFPAQKIGGWRTCMWMFFRHSQGTGPCPACDADDFAGGASAPDVARRAG